MKRRLMTALQVGMQLDTADTARTTKYYNYLLVCGSSDDVIKITLNGMDMALSGGMTLPIVISSLTVNSVVRVSNILDSDIKIVAFGDETDKYLSF